MDWSYLQLHIADRVWNIAVVCQWQWDLSIAKVELEKKACNQIAIGFSFAFHWLRGWQGYSRPIKKWRKTKPFKILDFKWLAELYTSFGGILLMIYWEDRHKNEVTINSILLFIKQRESQIESIVNTRQWVHFAAAAGSSWTGWHSTDGETLYTRQCSSLHWMVVSLAIFHEPGTFLSFSTPPQRWKVHSKVFLSSTRRLL